ncbi:MAG: outer membrane lipoprotein carrier protein LolA [Elusimicrobia bacterium]|nr:outer membrane lipoprotein carrier protein LolA [Elusimicrobiota bacterium]
MLSLATFADPGSAEKEQSLSVELTTTSILAKVKAYDEKIERITFKFTEEFFLTPTGEREKLTGRVYFDRKNFRVRADYSGRVKYKLWIDKNTAYLFDESLRQVVVRKWEDFGQMHLQAFMDLPVFFDLGKFEDRYHFSLAKASGAAQGVVYLRADPKKSATQPYHLLFGIEAASGRPESLKLVFNNYEASLRISDARPNAKFSDKIFDRQFAKDVSVIDMTSTRSE